MKAIMIYIPKRQKYAILGFTSNDIFRWTTAENRRRAGGGIPKVVY
jgi:hypothetical protein